MTRHARLGSIAVVAALGLIAAACGDDSGGSSTTTAAATTTTAAATTTSAAATTTAAEATTTAAEATTTAAEATTTAAEATTTAAETTTTGGTKIDMDFNHDGKVLIGVAVAGDANDHAYYQASVDGAKKFAADNGFATPVYIDQIEPAEAATEITNLAEQGVDVMIISSGELSDPIVDLAKQYPDIFWYCRCEDTFDGGPGIALSSDDSAAIEYIAGYATGLLLKAKGPNTDVNSVYMLGGSNATFEVETQLAFQMGLTNVDPAYKLTYVATGDHPFDFENVAGATEAFNAAAAAGADAIYPYLGGAHEPVVKLANDAGLIVMSAGASDVCTRTGDLHWDLAVKFDGGDYIKAILPLIQEGKVKEGDKYVFTVEPGSVAGASICNPTPDEQAALDAEVEVVASGKYTPQFDDIRKQAYGG